MYSIMSINMCSTLQDANIICKKSTTYITSISYQHYININLSPSIKLHIYKLSLISIPTYLLALLKTIPFQRSCKFSQACLGSIKGHPPFEVIQAASTGPNVGTVRTQNARPFFRVKWRCHDRLFKGLRVYPSSQNHGAGGEISFRNHFG